MSVWQKIVELDSQKTPFVVVTLVSSDGHAPQDPGAKCVVSKEGLEAGTIGGGKIEAHVIQTSKDLLEKSRLELIPPQKYKWNLQLDIGMTCGGQTEFLFEVHPQWPWSIALFGAGHVGQALARSLSPLNVHVTVIDDRQEWLDRLPAAPNIKALLEPEMAQAVRRFRTETFFVAMTRGHATDLPIIEQIFRTFPDSPFVGVMGSAVKAQKMRADLKARGVDANLIERLRSPIGMDFGSNDPSEIAISVTAQLLEVRDRWRLSSSKTPARI